MTPSALRTERFFICVFDTIRDTKAQNVATPRAIQLLVTLTLLYMKWCELSERHIVADSPCESVDVKSILLESTHFQVLFAPREVVFEFATGLAVTKPCVCLAAARLVTAVTIAAQPSSACWTVNVSGWLVTAQRDDSSVSWNIRPDVVEEVLVRPKFMSQRRTLPT